MWKKKGQCSGVECYVILLTYLLSCVVVVHAEADIRASEAPPVVKKEERWPVVSTDYGHISAVRLNDGFNGSYLLHFFSLEPNSILLPLILNADMILYVHAGSGRLSWTEEEEVKQIDLRRGDVYRLLKGTVFYIITDADQQQRKLQIHAIFANSNHNLREPETGPYSSVQDVVLGFDKNILQATFKVSDEVIDELLGGTKPPAITNMATFCRGFSKSRNCNILETANKKKNKDKEKEKKEKQKEEEEEEEKGKKRARLFNLFEVEKEIENCYGWVTSVSKRQLPALEGSNIGVFMVNLKAGSLMEPRWNTIDTEIVVVVEGRGVVKVSSPKERGGGRNMRFEVEEGDVFAAPRFHPMAEMAFNNGSFVFMGFSMMSERSKDQSIAGEFSVLRLLNKDVLGLLFNIKRTTLDEILTPREQTGISACISCAEEEMQTEGREEETGGGHEKRWWGEEEETGRRHGGGEEEEEEGGRQHEGRGGKREQQIQNYHNYEQGGRRILKRN